MNDEKVALSAECAELFNVLPVAMTVRDEPGNLLEVNEALCDLLGYTHDEITKMTWTDLLDPQDGEPAVRHELTRHQRILVDARGQRVFCDVHSALSEHGGRPVWLTAVLDVGQRHHYIDQLHDELIYDELTGLLNRRGIRHLLTRLLAENIDEQLAVLFCDLDNFKRINDSLGHEVGDELLVALAARLRNGLPTSCTPARHSGDEFLVVCSDLAATGGLDALTDTVSELLSTTIFPHGYEIAVSASIGAATVSDPSHTSQDLLRFADSAMYHAKNEGGARVVRADPAQISSLEQEMQLEGQLREALLHDELVLHYQPIVDQAGHVISAEALLRWSHPQHGMLSPAVIMPTARRAGLLADLDRWVLRTALHEAVQWPVPEGGRPVGVAVNLGSQLLHSPKFAEDFAEVATNCGIDWERVTLEITETDLLDLAPTTHEALTGLVVRGVRFAVDDFGTGYSSLERLKDLPVQVIKLDRKFVSGVGNDPVDTAIAGAALSIAHARGSSCIAEGVETTAQLYRLAALGYDRHQGFLFSPAVPAPELRTLITHPPALTGDRTAHKGSPVSVRDRSERIAEPVPTSPGSPAGARRQGEVDGATGLVPGEHLCWAYQGPEEFQSRAWEYALDGIRLGQRVEYLGNAPASHLRTQLALDEKLASALEAGDISVSSVADFYPVDHTGVVSPDATTAALMTATEEALAARYSGYRVVGDATPMVRTPAQREAFARYEYLFDHTMSTQPVTALCAYDFTQLGSPAIAELACLHPLTSPHASPFRLYSELPHGNGHLSLAGNVDLPCADLLVHALRNARQEELLVNDRGLEVLDPRALLALDHHAREHHQNLVLRLARPLATRLVDVFDLLTHTRVETQQHLPGAVPSGHPSA